MKLSNNSLAFLHVTEAFSAEISILVLYSGTIYLVNIPSMPVKHISGYRFKRTV